MCIQRALKMDAVDEAYEASMAEVARQARQIGELKAEVERLRGGTCLDPYLEGKLKNAEAEVERLRAFREFVADAVEAWRRDDGGRHPYALAGTIIKGLRRFPKEGPCT